MGEGNDGLGGIPFYFQDVSPGNVKAMFLRLRN